MDREDWQIAIGVFMVSAGVGWWVHPGVGVALVGVGLVIPFFLPGKPRDKQ